MSKNNTTRAASVTRGALAAGAATTVLLGGFGAFAMWSDSADMSGAGGVTTGSLGLTAANQGQGAWLLLNPESAPADVDTDGDQTADALEITDIEAFRAAPGDVLQYTVPVSGHVFGSDITADFGVDPQSVGFSSDAALDASNVTVVVDTSAVTLDGAPMTSTTFHGTDTPKDAGDADDLADGVDIGGELKVRLTFEEAGLTGATGQDGAVDLAALQVTLDQTV